MLEYFIKPLWWVIAYNAYTIIISKELGMQKSNSDHQNLPNKQNYKPDYGLALLKTGINQDTKLYFYSFTIYGIDILSQGKFSTMVEMPYDGEPYVLSLDFNDSQLDTILEQSNSKSVQYIKNELLADPYTPRSIDFTEPIVCDVVAKLGTLQGNNEESFVPLILIEASSSKGDQTINDKYNKKGFSIEDFVKHKPHSFKNINLNNLKPEKSHISLKPVIVPTRTKDNNNMLKDWWRWLLLPFVSVGAAYIGFYIFMFIQKIHPANANGYLSMITWIIIPIVGKAIFGFIFGLLSYLMAPRGKMTTSVVMITLLVVATIADIFLSLNNTNFTLAIKIQVLVSDIILIAGSIYGAKKAHEDN